MRAELREALSALADGELADPALVAEALLEPDAAELIVTLAEARATLRDTTSQPGADFRSRVERALAAESRPAFAVVRKFTPVLYAGLGLAAGILVGVVLAPPGTQPALTVVMPAAAPTFVATVPPVPVTTAPPVGSPPAVVRKVVPQAKSVYRFEIGRNWREGS